MYAKLVQLLQGSVQVVGDEMIVRDAEALRALMPQLARMAAFDEQGRNDVHALLLAVAPEMGVQLVSLYSLYSTRAKEKEFRYALPALNLRAVAFDTARAAFAAVKDADVGAFTFELARSEMKYTGQPPVEVTSVLVAAALYEKYEGPMSIIGDHFQVKAKMYAEDREKEIQALKDLIRDAISAGFYNIDIDASTIVDLSQPTIPEQQAENIRTTAELAAYVRGIEPPGVTVMLGGEIGEVGKENSTAEELRAFYEGFTEQFGKLANGKPGLSKIAIQTGSRHGGFIQADGSIAKASIDFDIITELGRIARFEYGLAGVVQHGASTLPEELFDKFANSGACEIHLATGFQNMLYDHPDFPPALKKEIETYIVKEFSDERKEGDSDVEFVYKLRKKALGPFKQKLWDMPEAFMETYRGDLQKKFRFLFEKLGVNETGTEVRAVYRDT